MRSETTAPVRVDSINKITLSARNHFGRLSTSNSGETIAHIRAISDLAGICAIVYKIPLKALLPEIFGPDPDTSVLGVSNRTKFLKNNIWQM